MSIRDKAAAGRLNVDKSHGEHTLQSEIVSISSQMTLKN